MSSKLAHQTVVASVTKHETDIWLITDDKRSEPEVIMGALDEEEHRHVRRAQHHGNHETDSFDRDYYKEIAEALVDVKEVLFVGHGVGKANAAQELVKYLTDHAPQTAAKVLAILDADLGNVSQGQILKQAREWFAEPLRTGRLSGPRV